MKTGCEKAADRLFLLCQKKIWEGEGVNQF